MQRFFARLMQLEVKRIKGKVGVLILLFLAILMLGNMAAFMAEDVLGEGAIKLNIGVVNLDTSPEAQAMIYTILSSESIEDSFHVVFATDESAARHSLQAGETIAYVVVPENFLYGVMSGENPKPRMVTNNVGTLERLMIENLASGLADVMTYVQSGIYTILDDERMQGEISGEAVLDANLAYVVPFLNRENMFYYNDLDYGTQAPIIQFYVLSTSLFLLFLSTTLFYHSFQLKTEKNMVRLLYSKGINYQLYYFAKIIPIYAVYTVLLTIIAAVVSGELTMVIVALCLLMAGLLVLVQSVLFQLAGNFLSAAVLNFILHSLFLVTSGGVIPIELMGESMKVISLFSPYRYFMGLLTVGLRHNTTAWLYIGSLGATVILCCITCYLNKKSIGDAYEYF